MTKPIPGYTGKIGFVDLTHNKTWNEETPWEIIPHVIGGKGLGAWYLYKLLPPRIDPLGPENIFIIATGPAQLVMPIAGRYTIVTKSPHTGLYIDSHSGGHVGPALKTAGYDAIIVKGASKEPVWLTVQDQQIHINNARDLWGLNTYQTEQQIKEQHDKKAKILSIGPAGEKLVRISSVINDQFRAIGRGGIGALWGAKKLKAISILPGDHQITIADEEMTKQVEQELRQRSAANREKGHLLYKHGTSWLIDIASELDQLPTLNFQYATDPEAHKLSGYAFEEKYKHKIRPKPCYKCTIVCSYVIKADQFRWAGEQKYVQHPEYETLALLGTNVGVHDTEKLLHFNNLCTLYGLDTISTGNTIGWFLETSQKGMVPPEYDAEKAEFGDEKAILDLIKKIAYRQGVGKVLSMGVKKAAQQFNSEALQWAIQVKGLEMPAWDPRGKLGLGLSYAVTPVGASHLRGWPVTRDPPNRSAKEVIPSLIEQTDLKILKDSLIMCHFTHSIYPALNIDDTAKILTAITGIQTDYEKARKIAHNIWTLTRLFNEREYKNDPPRKYDNLPPRLMNEPLPTGRAKGMTAFISHQDFEESLTELYKQRGLDELGKVPEKAKQHLLSTLHLNEH